MLRTDCGTNDARSALICALISASAALIASAPAVVPAPASSALRPVVNSLTALAPPAESAAAVLAPGNACCSASHHGRPSTAPFWYGSGLVRGSARNHISSGLLSWL